LPALELTRLSRGNDDVVIGAKLVGRRFGRFEVVGC
jgi:hypothetical protein